LSSFGGDSSKEYWNIHPGSNAAIHILNGLKGVDCGKTSVLACLAFENIYV
jgi:hypothetical protein